MNSEAVLKLLFELRATLDRIQDYDVSIYEAMSQDVERAMALTDQCISEIADEDSPEGSGDEEQG